MHFDRGRGDEREDPSQYSPAGGVKGSVREIGKVDSAPRAWWAAAARRAPRALDQGQAALLRRRLQRAPHRRFAHFVDLGQFGHRLALGIAIGRFRRCSVLSFTFRPNFVPLARARAMPSSQRLRIRVRSNSAMPPIIVNIRRPTADVVSHQVSPSDTKPQCCSSPDHVDALVWALTELMVGNCSKTLLFSASL